MSKFSKIFGSASIVFSLLIAIVLIANWRVPVQHSQIIQGTPHPYFLVGEDRRRELLADARNIRLGDTAESVLKLLGSPTFDERGASDTIPQFHYRSMRWYLCIWNNGLVNEAHDEYIEIVFNDENQKVESVNVYEKHEAFPQP